jgi:hypothetical protein
MERDNSEHLGVDGTITIKNIERDLGWFIWLFIGISGGFMWSCNNISDSIKYNKFPWLADWLFGLLSQEGLCFMELVCVLISLKRKVSQKKKSLIKGFVIYVSSM